MGRKLHFRMGSFYRTDDRTGFPQRADITRKEWTGLIVDEKVWEPRQPQDLVKGVPDIQAVPDPRPLGANVYVGPFSIQLAQAVGVDDVIVYLDNVAGLAVDDPVGIMMNIDGGSYFHTYIIAILGSLAAVILRDPMPGPAASGNLLTDFRTPQATMPTYLLDFSQARNSGYIPLVSP